MKKSLLIALGALALLTAFGVQAENVYTFNYGTWSLNGYSNPSPDDNSCVFSSRWIDGKQINVNVYPKYDGTQNVTMTVYNPAWNFAMSSKTYVTNVNFYSSKYSPSYQRGYMQVKASNRVIFRRMTKAFSTAFIHQDKMVLFAGEQNELSTDLTGTAELANALDECINIVLYPNGGEEEGD